jgi:hypothetical protein
MGPGGVRVSQSRLGVRVYEAASDDQVTGHGVRGRLGKGTEFTANGAIEITGIHVFRNSQ